MFIFDMKKTAILIDGEWLGKLARREGVQIIVVALKGWVKLTKALLEDADLLREIVPIA